MESAMLPPEYDEWLWSVEFDPPVETIVNEYLARLDYRLAHLFASRENVVSFSDFRIHWDGNPMAEDEAEEDDAPLDDDALVAAAIAKKAEMRMNLGVTASLTAEDLFAMMTGGSDGESEAATDAWNGDD